MQGNDLLNLIKPEFYTESFIQYVAIFRSENIYFYYFFFDYSKFSYLLHFDLVMAIS